VIGRLAALLLLSVLPGLDPRATPTPQPTPVPGEAEALVRQVARHYAGLGDLQGRFVQAYTNHALGRTLEERGRLLIAPPDRMRWEYQDPEPKLFVTYRDRAWFYLPEDAMAYRLSLDDRTARRLPSRLMAGDETLSEEFMADSVTEQDDGSLRLSLHPRVPDEGIESLVLLLRPPGPEIVSLRVTDSLGNVTEFRFPELEPVDPLDDSLFLFTPPEGVEVVDEG
jgi:outer membrane lipoprotein carrier protein